MTCPYRTHNQFVNWLVKYKGWKRSKATKLTLHAMRKMYYNGTPNLNEPTNMDFEEACRWYQEQIHTEKMKQC